MRQLDDPADQVIARIAALGQGVVNRRELLEAGVTEGEVRHRMSSGALIRVHPGVYRVGHDAPNTDAAYLAAVYACGAGAVLGGRAAAFGFALVKGAPPPPEVIAPGRHELAGVICRRGRPDRLDVAEWRGIPTLTVPATLVDLAGRLSIGDLARACHEAGVRYRTTPRHVEEVLARRPNAAGSASLRAVMSGEARVSLSRLESRFLEVLREQGLPLPLTNRPTGGRRVDCRWPGHRLTVELDSYGFHNSRHAWEQDHRREREAYARGDQFRPEPIVDHAEQRRVAQERYRGVSP